MLVLSIIFKKWTQSAMGADKVCWADEVIAESFAKRKKMEELSLFRLANWKQKKDLIDVCGCWTLRRGTKLSRCWLRLNESRLAMDTVRLEMKRRLLNSRAAWKRNFWTSLSEERREEPLSPCRPECRAGQSLKWCQGSGACRSRTLLLPVFPRFPFYLNLSLLRYLDCQ